MKKENMPKNEETSTPQDTQTPPTLGDMLNKRRRAVENLQRLLAEHAKRLKNFIVMPFLTAAAAFLLFLLAGIFLAKGGMGWFSVSVPVLGAAVAVLVYFLVKNDLFCKILEVDLFSMYLGQGDESCLRLEKVENYVDLLLSGQMSLIDSLQSPETEIDLDDFCDEETRERIREKTEKLLEKLEKGEHS